MNIEDIRKLKAETEMQILELLWRFTAETGLYLKGIAILEGSRIGQLYSEVTHVEIQTALPEKEKPQCTEICANPNLVEVPGSHSETEEVRQREWMRVTHCPLKGAYKCKFESR